MRYYLAYSAAFSRPPFKYHINKYRDAVARGGGFNVRTARQFGWPNQPPVVTFSVADTDDIHTRPLRGIEAEIAKEPPFCDFKDSLPCPLICEKDW
jgi:hypothetical protein